MKFHEIIEIRSDIKTVKNIESFLQEISKEIKRDKKIKECKIFNRAAIYTDFSIHIIHKSCGNSSEISLVGFRLLPEFRKYGLVNHSIWIETESKI